MKRKVSLKRVSEVGEEGEVEEVWKSRKGDYRGRWEGVLGQGEVEGEGKMGSWKLK